LGATPVADFRFMGPNMKGHLGVLYGVAEITFTIVRTCFQTTAEKYNSTFIGKYENLKKVTLTQIECQTHKLINRKFCHQ
jgi:hypothetical protein